jgi:fucose permease
MSPIAEDRKILLFIYSLAVLQGLTINLMPPLFRHVGETFHVGMARQGQLQTAFYFGTLLVGIVGGVLFERFGTKRTAVAAILLVSGGALVMGLAPSHVIVIAGVVLYGMGNGWMAVVFGATIARRFNERRQKVFTWAMLFLAVGAIIGPYLLSFLMERAGTWRTPLLGLAILQGVGGIAFFAARTPSLNAITRRAAQRDGSYLVVLRRGRLWLTAGLFLLHGFAGGILIAWVGRLYQDRLSITDERAALLLSVNAAGFFVGRFILGTWFAGKLPDRVLLGLCAGAGTCTYVLVIVGNSYLLAMVVMGCFGMFMSGDAPSIHSLVAKQFASSAGVAFALVQAMGAVGSTIGPWMIGALGERYGLHRAIWFGPMFLFSLAVTTFYWEFFDRMKERRALESQARTAVKSLR